MSERAIVYFTEQFRKAKTEEETLYTSCAISALEKRVPKFVNHQRSFWHYSHYCPACTGLLEREGLKYCPDCGQRLDWSNYFAGLKYIRGV